MSGISGSLAVLRDMTEEGWHSMDQMADLLASRLPVFAPDLTVASIRHPLTRIATPGPLGRSRGLFLADRLFNRFVLYPRRVRTAVRGRFDLYHIVDHTYAQLALDLPARRTIVTCHDVDAFRCLVEPATEARPFWFRAMAKRTLLGLRRAAIVVCGSEAARDDLVRFNLVDPARLRTVPNGIDPGLLQEPSPASRQRAGELLPFQRGVFDVLHVGSDIPRKRVDRLVEIVSSLRQRGHWIRLVRVGSPMRPETRQRAQELNLADYIELPFLERDVLRAVYERADLLLLTSDREGYGLPVLEAFAAGKPVVASDIPALRESSAGLATFVPPDSLRDWVDAVERALSTPDPDGRLATARRAHAASRTWDEHVRGLLPVYGELLEGARHRTPPSSRTVVGSASTQSSLIRPDLMPGVDANGRVRPRHASEDEPEPEPTDPRPSTAHGRRARR